MKRILPLISVLILIFASCTQKYFRTEGNVWGTSYHIVYDGPRDLSDSISCVTGRIDGIFSLFNPQSEICAVNAGCCDSVSDAFAELMLMAGDVWKLSGGVYDPTVAPLTRLWGFGPDDICSPTAEAVDSALMCVGLGRVRLVGGRLIRPVGMQFDFSSIAKGYGVDAVASMLERNGVLNYMVEIGGEVRCSGLNAKGKPWRIQVDSPAGGMGHSRLAICTLGPQSVSMASSGNYRNFRVDSLGCLYGHTISPLTGRPVAGNVLAATVVSERCAYADAIATACMAAGNVDSAFAVCRRAGVEALVVYADADTMSVRATEAFPFE